MKLFKRTSTVAPLEPSASNQRRKNLGVVARVVAIMSLLVVVPGIPRAAVVSPSSTSVAEPLAQGNSDRDLSWTRGSTMLQKSGAFLTGPAKGDHLTIALNYVRANKAELGLDDADLSDITVKDLYVSPDNQVTHLYIRQRLGGIEVYNGDIGVNLTKDGRIINVNNGFVGNVAKAANTNTPRLLPTDAVSRAARFLSLPVTEALRPLTSARGAAQEVTISKGGISQDVIPVKLMYQPVVDGGVRLVWDMVVRLPDGSQWLNLRVDALKGDVISQTEWSTNESIEANSFTTPRQIIGGFNELLGDNAGQTPQAAGLGGPTNAYRVYELPKHDPSDGDRTLVVNPADPAASPFGWHDTNGSPGAEFTITRGNNVHAYADVDNDDASDGNEPDGGLNLVFDFPLDLTAEPATYKAAATVNLFYMNNRIHDILYHYGFTEAAGNFQALNYSGAGEGNDDVQAEAQDGGGVTNANFNTPPDGEKPRMQMYLGNRPSLLQVESPASIAGQYAVSSAAGFGPQTFNGPTAQLVAVNDGVAAPNGGTMTDGCETPFVNAAEVAGKIALIDRGFCGFAVKAKNAQLAGAIGVIIANNVGGGAPGMGGVDPTVTIPALSISLATANTFRATMATTPVIVKMIRGGAQRDGSLDNGVIIHEYGHGVSNRLTGGPSNVGCLGNQEQAGEGWSDALALMLTSQPTDTAGTPITIGTWLNGQTPDAAGFRVFPYTTNMAINPHTYDAIKTAAVPHGVGSVWAVMVWEMYWNLVKEYGYDPNLTTGTATSGNRMALQLMLDGMKLQPCSPSFTQARDAILLADLVNNSGVNQCRIWEGFAKRGLGWSANAGLTSDRADGTQAFDLAPQCTLEAKPSLVEICAPEEAVFTVGVGPYFPGSVTLTALNVPAGASVTFANNPLSTPATTTLTLGNTSAILPGVYDVGIRGSSVTQTFTSTVELNVANTVPTAAVPISPTIGAGDQDLRPTLAWTASVQGGLYTVEVSTDAAFNNVFYTSSTRETSVRMPTSLRSGNTYYWRVMTQNACGAGATSVTGSFTVRATPEILLVDDDTNDPDVRAEYSAALTALGVSFDTWNVSAIDTGEPDSSLLANYNTVIWVAGTRGHVGLEGEEALQTMLDRGGSCALITSQEYFARRGVTDFMEAYLGVATAQDDAGQSVITGTGTIYGGLGPFNLSFPADNFADRIEPNGTGRVAFTGNAGTIGVSKDGGTYFTTYLAFPMEAVPTAEGRQSVLQRFLAACAAVPDAPTPTPTVPTATATNVPPTVTATAPAPTNTATSVLPTVTVGVPTVTVGVPTVTIAVPSPTRTSVPLKRLYVTIIRR